MWRWSWCSWSVNDRPPRSSSAQGDPISAVYGLPAVLAVLAVRGRGSLLLAAGTTSLVLAVLPFSLHSFLFGPIGVTYLLVYARWSTRQRDGSRSAAVGVGVPLLLVAAFLVLVVHDDPICYTRHASGEVTIDRDPDQVTSEALTIEAGSDVVERGCFGDTVVWWEAAASLALSASALTTAMLLSRDPPRHRS